MWFPLSINFSKNQFHKSAVVSWKLLLGKCSSLKEQKKMRVLIRSTRICGRFLLYLGVTSTSSGYASIPHNANNAINIASSSSSSSLSQSHLESRSRLLAAPWSATQQRSAKFRGSDVKPGQVIERKGKICQVLKAQHTQQGRGGAVIQVELRDIDSGNKMNERFRTDEALERVFVEEKSYKYLYTDDDVIVLMEPKTFEQLDVPKNMLGEGASYLKDDMTVTVQIYDGRPMSASIPQKVTCKVVEAQAPIKGIGATPHYKKVLLENGLTVQDRNSGRMIGSARMVNGLYYFDDDLSSNKKAQGYGSTFCIIWRSDSY